jgi:hypothetical protein
MSTVSSPLNFNDLKAASVYYEILGCDPRNLQAVCPEEQFERKADGSMVYYRTTANGSYVRANENHGEFVKLTKDGGGEVFLHHSQVFGPTQAAQRRMNTLAYVFGVTYASTYRQMAMLNDLINEAAALNESMRKFNDIYYSFAANALNYDSRFTWQPLRIDRTLLQLYVDNRLRLPLNRMYTYVITCEQALTAYRNIALFNKEEVLCFDLEAASRAIYANWVGSLPPDRISPEELYEYEVSHGCLVPLDVLFAFVSPDGLRKYAEGRGLFVPPWYRAGWRMPASLEEVLSGRKFGYFDQKESNAFLDQIRIALDQLNNELSGVSTMIGAHNQDLQQNYAVATSTIEASEEAHQKVTRNIR